MPERLLAPENMTASVIEFSDADATLIAESFGAGEPPFALLHGIGMGRSVFIDLARALPGRVIGIDLPGFGEAPEPPEPLSMGAHADLVAAALRAAGEGPVVLIGHSMGSQIAAEIAARHPSMVAALVLAGPTVDSAARSIRQQVLYLVRDLLGERPAVLWRGAREYLRGGPHLIAKMRRTIAHQPEHAYRQVRCPTLVLRGERDPMAPEQWCKQIVEAIPGARLEVIPGHGHGTLLSDTAHVAASIARFVGAR